MVDETTVLLLTDDIIQMTEISSPASVSPKGTVHHGNAQGREYSMMQLHMSQMGQGCTHDSRKMSHSASFTLQDLSQVRLITKCQAWQSSLTTQPGDLVVQPTPAAGEHQPLAGASRKGS